MGAGWTALILREFLARPAVQVAPELLGATLRVDSPDGTAAVRLTEVEAYEGLADPASHAFRGPTRRTAVMFGPPGHLYVYFSYGMHWCANVVCQPDGTAGAVLLRAGDVIDGVELVRRRRPAARTDHDLARGPARLTTAMGLSGGDDGTDLLDPAGRVRLAIGDRAGHVGSGPRVGISSAIDAPWRFWLAGAASVSPFRPGRRRLPTPKSSGADRRDWRP